MKVYIVYDSTGEERGYGRASSHNQAEEKARKLFPNPSWQGGCASVAGTEISQQAEKETDFLF